MCAYCIVYKCARFDIELISLGLDAKSWFGLQQKVLVLLYVLVMKRLEVVILVLVSITKPRRWS